MYVEYVHENAERNLTTVSPGIYFFQTQKLQNSCMIHGYVIHFKYLSCVKVCIQNLTGEFSFFFPIRHVLSETPSTLSNFDSRRNDTKIKKIEPENNRPT